MKKTLIRVIAGGEVIWVLVTFYAFGAHGGYWHQPEVPHVNFVQPPQDVYWYQSGSMLPARSSGSYNHGLANISGSMPENVRILEI